MSINLISPSEVRRLMEGGAALTFVDVRTPAEHARVHAAGARLVPLDTLDVAAVAALRKDPGEPIYLICQSGARAARAYERFVAAGIGPVFSVEGGTAAWERAGLPVERQPRGTISIERQVRIAAGLLVLLGTMLAWIVHPLFLGIPAIVGAGLIFAGITDSCAMGLMLGRLPWNR